MRRKISLRKGIATIMAVGVVTGVTSTTLIGSPAQEVQQISWFFTAEREVVIDAFVETPLAVGDVITLTFPEDVTRAD